MSIIALNESLTMFQFILYQCLTLEFKSSVNCIATHISYVFFHELSESSIRFLLSSTIFFKSPLLCEKRRKKLFSFH